MIMHYTLRWKNRDSERPFLRGFCPSLNLPLTFLIVLLTSLRPSSLLPLSSRKRSIELSIFPFNRADRKSQVRQCLGFCSADSSADEDHNSNIETSYQLCPSSNLLDLVMWSIWYHLGERLVYATARRHNDGPSARMAGHWSGKSFSVVKSSHCYTGSCKRIVPCLKTPAQVLPGNLASTCTSNQPISESSS